MVIYFCNIGLFKNVFALKQKTFITFEIGKK